MHVVGVAVPRDEGSRATGGHSPLPCLLPIKLSESPLVPVHSRIAIPSKEVKEICLWRWELDASWLLSMKDLISVGCTCCSTSSSVDEKCCLRENFPILCFKRHPFGSP